MFAEACVILEIGSFVHCPENSNERLTDVKRDVDADDSNEILKSIRMDQCDFKEALRRFPLCCDILPRCIKVCILSPVVSNH